MIADTFCRLRRCLWNGCCGCVDIDIRTTMHFDGDGFRFDFARYETDVGHMTIVVIVVAGGVILREIYSRIISEMMLLLLRMMMLMIACQCVLLLLLSAICRSHVCRFISDQRHHCVVDDCARFRELYDGRISLLSRHAFIVRLLLLLLL